MVSILGCCSFKMLPPSLLSPPNYGGSGLYFIFLLQKLPFGVIEGLPPPSGSPSQPERKSDRWLDRYSGVWEDGAENGCLAEIRKARHAFPVLSPCVSETEACLVRVVPSWATPLSREVNVVCSQCGQAGGRERERDFTKAPQHSCSHPLKSASLSFPRTSKHVIYGSDS